MGRYSEDGGEIISYLYLPEVKFNEEDFVHIENLEGDWYYAIYNYQPIKTKTYRITLGKFKIEIQDNTNNLQRGRIIWYMMI